MITIPPCILVAHDPPPPMRAAYGQEFGSHCELLFLPDPAPRTGPRRGRGLAS